MNEVEPDKGLREQPSQSIVPSFCLSAFCLGYLGTAMNYHCYADMVQKHCCRDIAAYIIVVRIARITKGTGRQAFLGAAHQ